MEVVGAAPVLLIIIIQADKWGVRTPETVPDPGMTPMNRYVGTGYGPDYYRAQPQEQVQPQQQPSSYGYSQQTRSQTYGYSQQPPATAYADPYSSSSYGAMQNPRQQGYMPAQQPVFGYGYQVSQMPQQQMQSMPMYQSRMGRRGSY